MLKRKFLVVGGLTVLAVGIIGTTTAFAGGGPGKWHGGHQLGRGVVEAVAEELGMEKTDLVTQLRDGNTIADLAGDDIDAVVDAIMNVGEDKLAEAVANQRITQERADELLAIMEERVTNLVNEELPLGGMHRHHRHHRVALGLINVVADQLGMERADVITQLREGNTITDLAGGETDAIVDAFMAKVEERLNQAVVNNRITQEEADDKMATIEERVLDKLDDTWPSEAHNGRGHRFGPRDGRGFGPDGISGFSPRGGQGFGSNSVLDTSDSAKDTSL